MPADRRVLLLILLVALALRIPLMFESLWFDEYYMSGETLGTFALLLKTLYADIHPPAYYSGMWLWESVFGDSELSLRTVPLLAGLGTIALVAALGERFVDRRTGLFAAALLALSPVHCWYSTESRPYSAQLFLLLLTVLSYSRLATGTERPRRAAWCYAIAIIVLVFTHYYMAAYAVAFSALAIATKVPRRRSILAANTVALLGMAAYVGFKLITSEFQTEKGYLRAFGLGEWWRLFFDWFLTGHTIWPDHEFSDAVRVQFAVARQVLLYAFQALGLLAFVLGVTRLVRSRGPAAGWQVLANAAWLPLFLLCLAWIGKDKTYIERSALPSYPFFAIILGAGLARLRAGSLVLIAFALLQLLATTLLFTQRDIPTVYRPNPDWRGAAAYLGNEIDAHGPGLDVYTPYASPDPLSYYEPRIQQVKTLTPDDRSRTRLLGAIERHLGPDSFAMSFAESMFDEFARSLERKRDGMRMRVHWCSHRDPRDAETDRSRPFYVIYPGDPEGFLHPDTVALLAEPGFEEVELRTWRWLRVHKIRYVQ